MAQFVYYSGYNGTIKLLAQNGTYSDVSASRAWQGACVDADGNLWAVVFNGPTYRGLVNRTTGAVTFTAVDALADTSRVICVGSDGALYRGANNKIYRAVPSSTLAWVDMGAPVLSSDIWTSLSLQLDGSLFASSGKRMFRGVISNGTVSWTEYTITFGTVTATQATLFSSAQSSKDGYVYATGYATSAYANRLYRGTVAGTTVTFDELANETTPNTTWIGLAESSDGNYLYIAQENDTHNAFQQKKYSKLTGAATSVGTTTTGDFRGVVVVDTDAPVVSLVGTTAKKVTVATRRAPQVSDYAFVEQATAPANQSWQSIKYDALGYTLASDSLYTSTDGVNWNIVATGIVGIQCAVRSATYLFIGNASSLYRANLDGTNPVAIGVSLSYQKQDIHIAPDGALWVATCSSATGDPGIIWRSTDNGDTFTDVYSTNHINYDGICFDGAGNVYVVSGSHSTIYKSPDNGATWSTITHPLTSTESVAVGPNGEIVVGGYGSPTMRISFDSGVTWLAMSLTPSDVEGMCFDNKGNLWVADYSTKKLWKASAPKTYVTTDGTIPLPYATGTYTDARDGKVYKTVLMPDGKWWFSENFAYVTAGSWDYNNAVSNRAVYGRLYTYADALASVPTGCHLPSNAEYTTMLAASGSVALACRRLKANDSRWTLNTGYDTYGFNAMPAGYKSYSGGAYSLLNTYCGLWTATTITEAVPGSAYGVELYDNLDSVTAVNTTITRTNGISVRYIVDSGNVQNITNVSAYTAPITSSIAQTVKAITVTGSGSKSAVTSLPVSAIFGSAQKVYTAVASGFIYSVDVTTGTETALTSTARAWEGVCTGSVGSNKLYASVNGGYVYVIDSVTGAETQLTTAAAYWRGPVYNPITKYLYAIAGDSLGNNCYVYQIDPVTGASSTLTSTARVFNGSLAVNSNGDMWVGISAGKILQINAVTGAGSVLPQSLVADWQDLCYSSDTGFLYGVTSNIANTAGSIYKINPATGATTLLGSAAATGYEGVTWDYKNARLLVSQNTRYISSVNPATGVVTALTATARGFRGIDYGQVYVISPQVTYNPPAGSYSTAQEVALYSKGTFTDPKDGKVYQTVLMPDGKWWFAENYAYASSDSLVPNAGAGDAAVYGRIYRQADAIANTPTGAHLPSSAELHNMLNRCGAISDTSMPAAAVSRMRDSQYWSVLQGTNLFGFSARPAGWKQQSGGVSYYLEMFALLTATGNPGNYTLNRIVINNDNTYASTNGAGNDWMSVRYIVDADPASIYYTLDESTPKTCVTGTYTDARDGRVYKTVLMPDGKWWFSENFAWAGSGVDYNSNVSNRAVYGRLYTWGEASVTPAGCHLPSQADFTSVIDAIGINTAGKVLKAASALWSPNTGSDVLGFNALPGGLYGVSSGLFTLLTEAATFWSSTVYSTAGDGTAYNLRLVAANDSVDVPGSAQTQALRTNMLSVRYIVDSGNVPDIIPTKVYTAPLSISATKTVKAVVVAAGLSGTANSAAYTITSSDVIGTVAASDVIDTADAVGSVVPPNHGTVDATDMIDTADATGEVVNPNIGTVTATDVVDTVDVAGLVLPPDTGVLSAVDPADEAVVAADVTPPNLVGSVAATDTIDVAVIAGVNASEITGTVATTDSGDAMQALGTIANAIHGTVEAEDVMDTFQASDADAPIQWATWCRILELADTTDVRAALQLLGEAYNAASDVVEFVVEIQKVTIPNDPEHDPSPWTVLKTVAPTHM